MKKYKVVAMDFDLTIADTHELIVKLLIGNAATFGVTVTREQVEPGIGCVVHDIYRRTGAADDETCFRMGENYLDYSSGPSRRETVFFPDIKAGIELLRSLGVHPVIFSQKMEDQMLEPLERAGMLNLFDLVIGYQTVKKTKPDPEGMYLIEKTFGVGADDILYTGDALTDEKTAKVAGVDFAAMLTGLTPGSAFDADYAQKMYTCFADLCADVAAAYRD